LSGYRESKVVVDIGFGNREYWAFINEYGQLVRVIADEHQSDSIKPVLSSGRYFSNEAKVPGVESNVLSEGHILADPLGGVSNAYNIPLHKIVHSTDKVIKFTWKVRIVRQLELLIFEAIFTYPNTEKQIPSSYQYTFILWVLRSLINLTK
jgi:hypothetical protein